MSRVYIGIGSNLENPKRQIQKALTSLKTLGSISRVSSLYISEPWGDVTGQPFFF